MASLTPRISAIHIEFQTLCFSSLLGIKQPGQVTAFQQSCTKHRNVKPSGSFNTAKLWRVETPYLPISKYFQTTCWIEWHSSSIRKCFGPKVLEGKSHYTHPYLQKKKNLLEEKATYCYQLQSNPEEQTKRWTLYWMYLISVQQKVLFFFISVKRFYLTFLPLFFFFLTRNLCNPG